MLTSDEPQRTKRPAPGWPFWVAFGVLLPLVVIALVISSTLSALTAAGVAEDQRLVNNRLQGNSLVVSGTYLESIALSGYPEIDSYYSVTLPNTAPGTLGGSVQTLAGPRDIGFPPEDNFPAEQDFLISFNSTQIVVEDYADPGSIVEVSEANLSARQDSLAFQQAIRTGAWVALALVVTVLPTLGIVFSVRRRRAARTIEA